MDIWADLERRIRERGVRVDERLALLALLRAPDAAKRLAALGAARLAEVEAARDALRTEAIQG